MKRRTTRKTLTKAELTKRMKSLQRTLARGRKVAEALRESEQRYRGLFDNASDIMISTFTLDGIITSVNAAYERATGWSRAELIGEHLSKMTAPESLPELKERTRRALAGERLPSVFEFIGVRKDGSRFAIEGRARFIRDVKGNPTGFQGIYRDITERKRAEAERALLHAEAEARARELAEALEQQTATSEILRVISQSPTDVQPVFDTIVRSAVRLSGGSFGGLHRFDGKLVYLSAHHNWSAEALQVAEHLYPMPLGSETSASAVALLSRTTVHLRDTESDPNVPSMTRQIAHALGHRSLAAVPMLREDVALGVIIVARDDPGGFTDRQIAQLETFADQAVIAIENVRLFKELQERNRDLAEALEQQMATSEILRVISSSPTDIQLVMDAVAENAARVCGADDAVIMRLQGDRLRFAAGVGSIPKFARQEEVPVTRGWLSGRAVIDRQTIHVHDMAAESEAEYPEAKARQQLVGYRTMLATPLLREGVPIGAIVIRRNEVRPFSEKQIKLLETFADQSVIAIENVRLFQELEAKNRELTTALDQQTATSEILRVVSSSPTTLQPIFDTIARNAARLCDATVSGLARFNENVLEIAATYGYEPGALEYLRRAHPRPPGRDSGWGRAVLERRVIHVHDVAVDTEYQHSAIGYRTLLAVPLLREGTALGAIAIWRREVKPFSDQQIALVETFADQAVIAIENVRLFTELQARTAELTRSVDELTALGEVSRALSSTLDLDTVLTTIVSRAIELSGTDAGTIWEYEQTGEDFHLRAARNLEDDIVGVLRATPLRRGEGTVGRLVDTHAPIQIADISGDTAYRGRLEVIVRSGYRAILSLPLLREDRLIGALTVNAKTPREFPSAVIDLLTTFATQSALAIQNARLFRELADKSHQLEVASQHKSEFLANMSHELRTPLNAIIGFSEVLTERMFGELNEKQDEYLKDIYASGQHLLSLINDILDLSKIEAGRMELELNAFDLQTAIDNALILVRERAGRRGIALGRSLDERVSVIHADERKVKQVLLNLLSNALKFTPEGGRIEVRAVPVDGSVEISVSDTGVGIAPEDQEAVFEEFRQVGTPDKKVEGTGLGLSLARKFIELHGGRIRVQSEVGRGSTFTFTIPVRQSE